MPVTSLYTSNAVYINVKGITFELLFMRLNHCLFSNAITTLVHFKKTQEF